MHEAPIVRSSCKLLNFWNYSVYTGLQKISELSFADQYLAEVQPSAFEVPFDD